MGMCRGCALPGDRISSSLIECGYHDTFLARIPIRDKKLRQTKWPPHARAPLHERLPHVTQPWQEVVVCSCCDTHCCVAAVLIKMVLREPTKMAIMLLDPIVWNTTSVYIP